MHFSLEPSWCVRSLWSASSRVAPGGTTASSPKSSQIEGRSHMLRLFVGRIAEFIDAFPIFAFRFSIFEFETSRGLLAKLPVPVASRSTLSRRTEPQCAQAPPPPRDSAPRQQSCPSLPPCRPTKPISPAD